MNRDTGILLFYFSMKLCEEDELCESQLIII